MGPSLGTCTGTITAGGATVNTASMDQRRSESPAHVRVRTGGGGDDVGINQAKEKSAGVSRVESVSGYALRICQSLEEHSRIDAVVKSGSTTVVKLNPGGVNTTANKQFAMLSALKIAFPFYTVSLVENASTGASQLQILFCSDELAFFHAKEQYKDYKVFRAIRAFSTALACASIVSFATLAYVDTVISTNPPGHN
jgi:hypothetical protein